MFKKYEHGGHITIMAQKCQKCNRRDKCDKKRMEACAYLVAQNSQCVTIPDVAETMHPMSATVDYRNLKVGENTVITVDVEQIKKQLEQNFYKKLGINCGV